ncbi:HTH-type transcriptional activator RhaS [Cellulomonas sp. T2.31MG-18]|uniref:helix-turn-helix transcriptional regulator n=1 Tax=Cellulomonas sp. T2.31MG-18 TaxID=3157619 RepID=UPI0035F0F56B
MAADLDELRRLRRARDRIDREYAEPLDVPALAGTAFMSTAHFSRRFREAYGETPYAYLMTRRIERAKALLRRGDLSVTEVCFEVGCTSLGSFSSRFTELVGQTPSEYRAADHSHLHDVPVCQVMAVTRPQRRRSSTSAGAGPGATPDTVPSSSFESSSFEEAPATAPA